MEKRGVSMIKKSKAIDWLLVGVFIMWILSTDFTRMTTLSWVAGGLMLLYLILVTFKRINSK